MSLGRSCRIHNTFQLQGSNDVFALVVSILIIIVQLNRIESGSNHDGAVFLCDNLVLLCVVNRSCLADFRADTTFSGLKFDTILGIDNRDIWNRLRKRRVDSASRIQSPVKFTCRFLGRTFLLTDAAAGTFVHVHISCLFADIHGKISHEPAYFFHFTICMDMNLLVC